MGDYRLAVQQTSPAGGGGCSVRRSSDGGPFHQQGGTTSSNGVSGGGGGAGGGQPPPGSRAVSAYSSSSHSHSADFSQSTLNLVTCVLGAGALGYPFCFKECGLLLATIIMFITLVATRISYQLLLYCAQLSGRKSYESIAEHALGKTGRQIVEVCIAAMNLGALVAFLDILADVLSAVAGTIIPPGAEPSRNAYITGVTLLGALPVSLVVREPSVIANMSNAAVVFVVVFAVVVFCTAFGPSAASALGVRWAALTHGGQAALAASAIKAPVLHMWNPQVCLRGVAGSLQAQVPRRIPCMCQTSVCSGLSASPAVPFLPLHAHTLHPSLPCWLTYAACLLTTDTTTTRNTNANTNRACWCRCLSWRTASQPTSTTWESTPCSGPQQCAK